jgi:hypothetical protein
MPSASAGLVRKHKDKRVVVLKTGLSTGGASAVMVARLSSTKPRGHTRCVEAKTFWGDYWVLLDQLNVVGTAELVTPWTGPERLNRSLLDTIRKEIGKLGE